MPIIRLQRSIAQQFRLEPRQRRPKRRSTRHCDCFIACGGGRGFEPIGPALAKRDRGGQTGASCQRPCNLTPCGGSAPRTAWSPAERADAAGFVRRRIRPRSPPRGRPQFRGHRGARARIGGRRSRRRAPRPPRKALRRRPWKLSPGEFPCRAGASRAEARSVGRKSGSSHRSNGHPLGPLVSVRSITVQRRTPGARRSRVPRWARGTRYYPILPVM